MIAIKARFDGQRVILPPDFEPPKEQDVLVLFDAASETGADDPDRAAWAAASTGRLREVWDNADDAIYDDL